MHTQLASSCALLEALGCPLEREMVMETAQHDMLMEEGEIAFQKPLWLKELTELIKGLAVPPAGIQETWPPSSRQHPPWLTDHCY